MAGGSVTFQAQNPAKSGDKSTFVDAKGRRKFIGWTNCTAFVAAMGAEFDRGVRLTGTQVRQESSEPVPDPASPGLNLTQARAVLLRHGISIDVETPIDFDHLDDLRLAGHAIGLQLGYRPIRRTGFSGSRDFDGGHIVLWLPSGEVYDPLDDGRMVGTFRAAKAPVRIPTTLLREAAGSLLLNPKTGRTVGLGRAYAAIFPNRHPANGTPPAMTPPTFRFGATASGAGEYRVVVQTALVRSSPGGVPGKTNVVARRSKGTRIRVIGTTSRGQSVGSSRVWHEVDRAGTQFMHSSVIDPVDLRAADMTVGLRAQDFLVADGNELPLVDDPDATGVDEAQDEETDIVVDAPPKTDVPDEDEPEDPPAG